MSYRSHRAHLEDVDEDELLPEGRAEIAAYLCRRQPEVLRNLSRHGAGSRPAG